MTDSQRWMVFVGIVILAWLTYILSPVLIPFVIAFLLAYFLDPLVVRLHRWYVPRVLAAFIVFIIAVVIIALVLFSLVPALQTQIVHFIQNLPHMVTWLNQTMMPSINHFFDIQKSVDINSVRDLLLKHVKSGGGFVEAVFSTVAHSGYTIMEVILNIVMIPVVTLYLLCDWEKVKTQGRLYIPLPHDKRETMLNLVRECGDRLAGFIRGQLMVMIGLAIVYTLGLWLVGLDLALLIGIMSGILSVVPYLGFVVGILSALIAGAIQFDSGWYLLAIVGVYAVGEACESLIFSPFFVGDRIGLHPVAVIFAVLVGGRLFGFVGVLLALPVSAVIMVFFRYLCQHYFPSKIKGEHV